MPVECLFSATPLPVFRTGWDYSSPGCPCPWPGSSRTCPSPGGIWTARAGTPLRRAGLIVAVVA